MANLHHELIDGVDATVAYLDRMGGTLVEPEQASFAIAKLADGRVMYLRVSDTPKGVQARRDTLGRRIDLRSCVSYSAGGDDVG